MAETDYTSRPEKEEPAQDEARERYLAYRRQYYRKNRERILAQNRSSAEARKERANTSIKTLSTKPKDHKPTQKKISPNRRPVKDLSTNYDRDIIFAAIREEMEDKTNA